MRHARLVIASLVLAGAPALVAQQITRISAPAIGKTFTIEYTSAPGAVYVMFAASPPPGSIVIPGIGTLFLNPASILHLYSSSVPGSGTDAVGLPLPNDTSLLNACIDFQGLQVIPGIVLTTNYIEACLSRGIGTITLVEATDLTFQSGNMQVQTVTNATAGAPLAQALAKGAAQSIFDLGPRGLKPLVAAPQFVEQADIDIDRGDVVARDQRNLSKVHMQLPNGFDLYAFRDAANFKDFYLVSLDRATGAATELTGSRVTDLGTAGPPNPMYRSQFEFTTDGKVAIAIVHDSTNSPVGNVGPPDRVFLIKTDPSETWANSKDVLDVSPAAGPDRLHTATEFTLRIANGFGFVEGKEPSGVTGEGALWAGPIDGSALWTRIPVPQTGTLKNFYWIYSAEKRISNDQKTQTFTIGGNSASNSTDMDLMAITNIGMGPLTVVNITKFAAATQVLAGPTRLSPDGKNAAIVIGGNTAASPGRIAIVKTDGSQAGAVTSFTSGKYDAKVIFFMGFEWLSNTKLIYRGGSAGTATDYYLYDTTTSTITNLTKTTNGTTVPPFCTGGTHTGNIAPNGAFMSENGLFYYFLRAFTTPETQGLGSDWKGINATTNAVFDVTGSEFSGGLAPSIRPSSVNSWNMLPRRSTTNELFFVSAKNSGVSATILDDEIFKFNPEAGTQAVQLTANNGSGTAATVQRIADLRLNGGAGLIAYTQAIGTALTNPENLYTITNPGGVRTQISRNPAIGVQQGIASGSVYFTPSPADGLCWVQGTNSRATPTTNAVALWNSLAGVTTPLRLGAPPVATTKGVFIFNTNPRNP